VEFWRQRTPGSIASPTAVQALPQLGDLAELGLGARSILSDVASEEELELWAKTVDLPGFEDNVSPSNTITALLRFTFGELVIHLPRTVAFRVRITRIYIYNGVESRFQCLCGCIRRF